MALHRLAFLRLNDDKWRDDGPLGAKRKGDGFMEDLLKRISTTVGIDENTAKAAVGHVLAFLNKELPEGPVSDLLGKIPGSQEAIAAAETTPVEGLGAALGGLGSLLGGAKGDIMALAGKLSGIGLDMGQMQKLSHEIFAHAEDLIGKENVDKIIAAIPALAPFR
jgi:hypothetical protein